MLAEWWWWWFVFVCGFLFLFLNTALSIEGDLNVTAILEWL